VHTGVTTIDRVTAHAAAGGESIDYFPGLDLSAPDKVAPGDARVMSRVLFARLVVLEEGTREYQYVRNTLIELNMALVKFAARRFRTRSEPMEDILQVGTIGLIKAIDRYDPDRGTEFATFALPTVIGEIKRFFRDTSWAVHVPRRLQELRLVLARAADDIEQKIGHPPTAAELAEALDLPLDEVREGMVAANGYTPSSLDAKALGAESEDEESAFLARLGKVDPGIEGVENLICLKPLIADLPDRDRRILSMRFGAEMTQAEIGAELDISQMHVSRLLNRTMARLRAGLLGESESESAS